VSEKGLKVASEKRLEVASETEKRLEVVSETEKRLEVVTQSAPTKESVVELVVSFSSSSSSSCVLSELH
jgi:hypothetical protein